MRRIHFAAIAVASIAGAFVAPSAAHAQCGDTCATARDNECDDGGPGSAYGLCDFGSDCSDCGPRMAPAVSADVMALTLQEELYYLVNEINYYVTTNARRVQMCGLADAGLEALRQATNEALAETPTDPVLNCLDAVANLMDCIATLDCTGLGTLHETCAGHFDNVDVLCQ